MKTAKPFITFFLILAFFFCSKIHANPPSQVTFHLTDNLKNSQAYHATFEIENLPHPGEWKLAFNLVYPRGILSIKGGEIVKNVGDFVIIQFSSQTNSKIIEITGDADIRKYSEAPTGYFLIDTHNRILPIQSETILPESVSTWSPDKWKEYNIKKFSKSIENNSALTDLSTATSLLMPLPVELKRLSGQFNLNEQTTLFIENSAGKNPAQFFIKALERPMGYPLKLQQFRPGLDLMNSILFTSQDIETLLSPQQRAEGYVIEVNPSMIIVRAATETGFFYAIQSLRQLLPVQIYNQQPPKPPEVNWNIPSVRIIDYPRFEYRGLHLDSARHFMPTQDVKRLIDLMAIHKLNYFQWHLTDDEAWRIEIKQYPQLTQKGAWRGFNPMSHNDKFDLLPSLGSGAEAYGGYYSQDEIKEIVAYAMERQITVIPEIDLPGHARAMILSLPEQLIDTDDLSDYTSVQGYKDNVLAACDTKTLTVIENIISEITDLFPSTYIHIGGDEVPKGAWEKSSACHKLGFNPELTHYKDRVQNYFLQQVQKLLASKGKIMAGWEEIASAESMLEAPLRIYIWNSAKTAQVYKTAVQRGYEIIQAPAENLYFDLSYNASPKEPGQSWAGYVDTFSAYSFVPVDENQGYNEMIIKGVQGQLWSEQIRTLADLDYFAFPKIAGLAELAWTPANRRNWQNFYDRMSDLHLQRLENYGVKFHNIEFTL